MKEIVQEVNKIASEINSGKDFMNQITSDLFSTQDKKVKLERGFNFLGYSNLIYSFNRFYPLCDKTLLSEEANSLHKELSEELNKNKHLIDGT